MTTTPKSEYEIALTRVLRASPERVFDAWTDPAKLAKWFGPDGFTTTTHHHDPRPGGEWRHTMTGPDGTEYPNHIRFVEVSRPKRLVYDHLSSPPFRTTVTFEPEGEGTRMHFVMRFPHEDAFRVATERHGAREGQKQTVARLAAFVEGFVIEREFRASPDRVWRMWTTPEGIMRWWALSAKEMGYAFTVVRMDVRPGGGFAFRLVGNGHDLVNGGTYRVVEPPRRLAWTWHYDIFLDPEERPYDVPIEVALDPTPGGGTRMTFRQGPLAKPEFTEGSRLGVEQNLRYLAKALDE